jgi:hypothetical protein
MLAAIGAQATLHTGTQFDGKGVLSGLLFTSSMVKPKQTYSFSSLEIFTLSGSLWVFFFQNKQILLIVNSFSSLCCSLLTLIYAQLFDKIKNAYIRNIKSTLDFAFSCVCVCVFL